MTVPTKELEFEGVIDDVSVKTGKKGDYVKLKVNGKTFNFRDMDYYNSNKEHFKLNNRVRLNYVESTWKGEMGDVTSNWVNSFVFLEATKQTVLGQGTSVPLLVETMMLESMESAVNIVNTLNQNTEIKFTPEDTRHIGISMFIEKSRRRI